MQLTPPILIAGESAAASAVEEDRAGAVVTAVLWNRDCCCRIIRLAVPQLVVELVDVEIAVRSTAGLTLKAEVVVIARLQ